MSLVFEAVWSVLIAYPVHKWHQVAVFLTGPRMLDASSIGVPKHLLGGLLAEAEMGDRRISGVAFQQNHISKCVLTRFSAGHKSDSNLVDRVWRHPRFRNGWTRSGEKTTKNTWEGSDMLCRWENFGSLSASKCSVSWWGIQTPNAAWSLLSDNRVEAGAARHTSTPYMLYFRAPDSKPSYHNLS